MNMSTGLLANRVASEAQGTVEREEREKVKGSDGWMKTHHQL